MNIDTNTSTQPSLAARAQAAMANAQRASEDFAAKRPKSFIALNAGFFAFAVVGIVEVAGAAIDAVNELV